MKTSFYNALKKDGWQKVKHWTRIRDRDPKTGKVRFTNPIFDQNLIFITINEGKHWSQCVVVNPGCIENSFIEDEEKKAELELSCLIFMDSLGLHNPDEIWENIVSWLNGLWRCKNNGSIKNPFSDRNKFPVILPKGEPSFATTNMNQLNPQLPFFVLQYSSQTEWLC